MVEVAKVYSNSLFELAIEKKKLDECNRAYDDFMKFYNDDKIKKLFLNPIVSDSDKISLIENICIDSEIIFKNFLKVIVKKGRESYIEECYNEFNKILSSNKNEINVEIKAAKKLNEEQINNIISNIEKNTGKKVLLNETIDPSLLMGFDVLIEGKLLDLSLEATFERLRKKLKKIEVKL